MTSQELGSSFEAITKDFFVWLFEEIGFTVTKARPQKSGSQNGFDILIIVSKDFTEKKIFIECKNYDADLPIGNILKKGLNLESNYDLVENDLFIAINPKSNFSNEDNSEKLSPVLSEKFKFTYYALDISNGIRELFALNNHFYRSVYGKDVDFNINREKELDRFKAIIFSRKPFKKVIITDADKNNFIGDIVVDKDNIERYFTAEAQNNTVRYTNNKKENLTLSQILEKEDKIFIIGNPGIGKSTELKKFALQNWKTGENENFVPIFKSLKNFTNTDSITDYFPSGWQNLNNVFFILDGIDEISDIEYFKSKLENFVAQNLNDSQKFKFIISCRSNVYESIVKGIPNFSVYYLRDLYTYESIEILKRKCGGIIESLSFNNSFINFLKTPFQLEILADYIKNNAQMPQNTNVLWEQYINNRFTHDKNDKLKKIALNVPALKKWSMKVSLINELMKSNIIEEEDLYAALGESTKEYEEFTKNPLINKLINEEKFFFEHRNLQEYFAATALSKLSSEKIKRFLYIENGVNKTHPSLFNTITFLINILDKEKYEELVSWLMEDEPELLFKADSDRTQRYKVKVFQDYFHSECVEKTFWINTSRTFTTKEIAEFGNCETNFDHLLVFINDPEAHFRVKVSALELLSHFSVPKNKRESLKKNFYDLLQNSQNSEIVKTHILDCIHDLKLCENDENFLDDIFEIFRNETSKQINRALLSLLEEYQNIDRFFWYIKAEFLRDHGFAERKVADDVMRGTSWALDRLVLRFNEPANFIDLSRYCFDEGGDNYIDSKYIEEIIDRCSYFENLDYNFLVDLFRSFQEIKEYYFRETAIKDLILKSSSISKQNLFEYLTENSNFKIFGYFLASVTDKETIGIVIKKFAHGTIDRAELDSYRNVLGNTQDRKLAEYFNTIMIEKGFEFESIYPNEIEFENLNAKFKKRPQEDFDVLFDKELLLSKIKSIFNRYGDSIEPNMTRKITTDWYNENGRLGRIEIPHSILSRIIHKNKAALKYSDIERIFFEDEILIIKEIKAQIQQLYNSNVYFEISTKQLGTIFNWCLKAKDEIDFTKIVKLIDHNSLNLLEDYEKLKATLYFAIKFKFDFPEDFLLNSVEYIDINRTTGQEGTLNQLLTRISNKEAVTTRILQNLENGNLYSLTVNSHIQYALDHKVQKAFYKIREYLLNKNHNYNIEKFLRQYIELTNDIELLKTLCNDLNSHRCWTSLKLMMELNTEPDFCLEKANLYLSKKIYDTNYFFYSALSILFELNSVQALNYLIDFLDLEDAPSLNQHSYKNYNVINDYGDLHLLYEKIYVGDQSKFRLSDTKNFMTTYVANLSKDNTGYVLVQNELSLIKSKIKNCSTNNDAYYVNHLIEESKKGFINSQSKTFNFNEALAKVDKIIN
ncbi:NACHT domain-containing protein [Flavobacterium sp. FlaQc-51]|uniref:NACHT domain-containing protein n=1 Tax=Flavobacterium sp. FlaQc-51 TaxID=3374184 RepID=UPI003756D626